MEPWYLVKIVEKDSRSKHQLLHHYQYEKYWLSSPIHS